MAEISRLPGPVADLWDWQLEGLCRRENPDVFFQAREACSPFYAAVPDIVQAEMDRFFYTVKTNKAQVLVAQKSVSVAKWEGPALVIVTKTDMGNGPQESTQKWTVSGSVLTIETTNARGTQKMVYKK